MPLSGIVKRAVVIASCVSFAVMPLAAAPAAAPNPIPGSPPAGASHPNVVILVADDWGFSDVGSFGAGYATPTIDAPAHAGMRLSNFHVPGSFSPHRPMLPTGVLAPH